MSETMTSEGLQVRKNPSRDETMSDAAYVEEAAAWARRLTQSEARGPGDLEPAWRRLEARYGVSWRDFWSLRYRKPSKIATSLYMRLQAAYRAECERQMQRLRHELEITRTIAGPAHPVVVQVQAVVDAAAAPVGNDDLTIPEWLRRSE
jgi:hypothetical protein